MESLSGEKGEDLVVGHFIGFSGSGWDGSDLGIEFGEFGGEVWASWRFCPVEFGDSTFFEIAIAVEVVPVFFEVAEAVSAVVSAAGDLLAFGACWFGSWSWRNGWGGRHWPGMLRSVQGNVRH